MTGISSPRRGVLYEPGESITLARFPLLVLLVWMLCGRRRLGRFLAVPGVVLLIVMDAFDGICRPPAQ